MEQGKWGGGEEKGEGGAGPPQHSLQQSLHLSFGALAPPWQPLAGRKKLMIAALQGHISHWRAAGITETQNQLWTRCHVLQEKEQ